MADTGTFPTIRNVLVAWDNIKQFTAGAALTAGMVVAFAATGVSRTVHPAIKGTTAMPVGVVLYDTASGANCAVACRGCWVYACNADETAIDAGDPLEDNDNAIGGTVSTAAIVDAGVVAVVKFQVGFAIDDIAANATGVIEVAPGHITSANNA
jgi:hypothetical protein